MSEEPVTFEFSLLKATPRLWIREIALFGKASDPEPIRTIPLEPGLNIIQGIDHLEQPGGRKRNGVGHGVGKTLLCRLVRYLFGEKTFGKKAMMEKVIACFPAGFVGARVCIDGEDWTITRTFAPGPTRASRTLGYRELAAAKDDPTVAAQTFLAGLGRLFVDDEAPGPAPDWPALLAWCSRDQEARHKNLLQWRTPDSESKVAVDRDLALRTVRAVLGVGGHMREKEDARRRLQQQLADLDARISSNHAKLEGMITRETQNIGLLIPGMSDLLVNDGGFLDPTERGKERLVALAEEIDEVNGHISRLLPQIDEASRSRVRTENRWRSLTEAIRQTNEGPLYTNPNDDGTDPNRRCDWGQVDFGECQDRKRFLEKLKPSDEEQEDSPDEETMIDREQVEADIWTLEKELAALDRTLRDLKDGRDGLYLRLGGLRSEKEQLEERSASLSHLKTRQETPAEDEESAPLLREREEKTAQVAELTMELDSLTEMQSERVTRFSTLIDWIAKKIMGDEMSSTFVVTSTTLNLGLTEGDGGEPGGEHYETTMKVLLLDLAAMLSGAARWSLHPAVLLHDSPKEAEMQDSLFDALLTLLATLTTEGGENTPFQYIVVTASRAPVPAQPYVRDQLWRGEDGKGFLLRRKLTPSEIHDMFAQTQSEAMP